MKKLVVCLANSWKTGGRCLAGVEVKETAEGYEIVESNGEPVWIRPISDTEHGELSKASVSYLRLLDVIEIECNEHAPAGAQSENWHFQNGSIKRVASLAPTPENLKLFLSHRGHEIFGNHGKAVHEEQIHEVDHSLVLIQAHEAEAHTVQKADGKNQVRIKFIHGGHSYDLAVTDPAFAYAFEQNPQFLVGAGAVFVTISLGLAQNDYHSKLVAGVIRC